MTHEEFNELVKSMRILQRSTFKLTTEAFYQEQKHLKKELMNTSLINQTNRNYNQNYFKAMNSLIAQARKKGFVFGATCLIKGGVRVMTSGRIHDINGNLLVMCQHPFFIRFRGEWVAEVIKKNPNKRIYYKT